MKTKTINQIGIVIGGESVISLWGGGEGTIKMDETFIPNDKISKQNILRCVNDGGFGCESIDSSDIDIYIKFDNGCREYDRTIYVNHPLHTQFFLGWMELNEQGIKC